MKLQGRTALITGAARRLGREIALTLARRGASIVIHYRDSRKEASTLQKEIEAVGSKAYLAQADFSGKSTLAPTIKNFLKTVYKQVPRIDVLVNNAAIFYPTPFGKINEKDWDNFLTVNLKAPFFLSQEIGKRMLKQKSGKIINLVDWTGIRPQTQYLPYCVSKAGLIAVTKGLAKILAPHVHVIGIAPGPILPPEGMGRAAKNKVMKKTPLKRFGSPKDIANTVRFVVEDTDFISGAIIPVEGGSLIA